MRRKTADAERIRQAAATAIKQARASQVAAITFALPSDVPLAPAALGQALAEGLELGAYRYLQHQTGRTAADKHEIASVTVVTAKQVKALAEGIATGQAIAGGTNFARDLVNTPGEMKTPPQAGAAGHRARRAHPQHPASPCTTRCASRPKGFGGILAVGKGSDSPPRFIIMEYGKQLKGVPTICLVGKGLTFDSGGLNIKPAEGMETMKNDMGGSAAVFGVMQTVAELGLPLHVVGLVPSAENMPSGRSYRPGDIVTTLSGKTIEVLNTDAEGRVILSDGLHFAQRYKPAAIVELSTLTGAVIIALGSHATAVMATDQSLADRLVAAGGSQRRQGVAAAAVGRVPPDGEERHRRPEEPGRSRPRAASRLVRSWRRSPASTRSPTSTSPARRGSTRPPSRTTARVAPAPACASSPSSSATSTDPGATQMSSDASGRDRRQEVVLGEDARRHREGREQGAPPGHHVPVPHPRRDGALGGAVVVQHLGHRGRRRAHPEGAAAS